MDEEEGCKACFRETTPPQCAASLTSGDLILPTKRYALVDTSTDPQAVVDIITINDNPGEDDHETLVATEPYHAVLSISAKLGWVWDGETLKEPQP